MGDRAKALVVEFLEANKQAPRSVLRSLVRWLPSAENCYKANFDAAMFESLGYAGFLEANKQVLIHMCRGGGSES